jgi:RND superfamily putative drug exporter
MAKDPVCSMQVDEGSAAATATYRVKTYYFCCPGCKNEFDASPEKYVTPGGFGLSTEGLARGSAHRPWRVIGAWAAILVAGLALAYVFLSDGLTIEFAFINNPESKQADTLLEERLRGPTSVDEVVIVQSDTLTVDDPAFQVYVNDLYGEIMSLGPDVVEAGTSYYETSDAFLVSADKQTTLVPLVMEGSLNDAGKDVGRVHEVVEEADGRQGFKALIAGDATLMEDFKKVAEDDFRTGDLIGIGAALVILVLVFGAVTKAALPVVLGITSVAVAAGAAAVVGIGMSLYFMITIMIAMVGLAVGIDYSLFILSRYSEERRRGLGKIEAIAATGATASRAVLFSGITVVLALLAMFIVPMDFFRSMALGAVLAVIVAVLAALTLMPAILSVIGDRINSLRISLFHRKPGLDQAEEGRGFWEWITNAIMRRPVASVVLAGGLLLAAALPVFGMSTGMAGVATFPDDTHSKEGFLVLQEQFSGGLTSPVEIVIDGDIESEPVQAGVERLQATLETDPRFGPSRLVTNPGGDLALMSVPPTVDPMGDEALDAVRELRSDYVPQAFSGVEAQVLVTGESAWHVDFFAEIERYMPLALAVVLGLTFVLLMLVFRSLVIPAKAILMNLLSVGAAYGMLVLVFQEGYGADLLGFQRVDKVEAWLPLFLFSILFGLSMDYHVFLLSRIRERFDQTGDNSQAVAFGLRSTGSVITGAAAIMVAVFVGFALGDLVATQQMGFGLAVAVLLDATVVRIILVPATMRLLGKWNWWLPSWLRWLPHLGIEGRKELQPVWSRREHPERA